MTRCEVVNSVFSLHSLLACASILEELILTSFVTNLAHSTYMLQLEEECKRYDLILVIRYIEQLIIKDIPHY